MNSIMRIELDGGTRTGWALNDKYLITCAHGGGGQGVASLPAGTGQSDCTVIPNSDFVRNGISIIDVADVAIVRLESPDALDLSPLALAPPPGVGSLNGTAVSVLGLPTLAGGGATFVSLGGVVVHGTQRMIFTGDLPLGWSGAPVTNPGGDVVAIFTGSRIAVDAASDDGVATPPLPGRVLSRAIVMSQLLRTWIQNAIASDQAGG